jgi:hypothetical protein
MARSRSRRILRAAHDADSQQCNACAGTPRSEVVPVVSEEEQPRCTDVEQTPEDAVLTDYLASLDGPGRPLLQRFLADKYGIDRRKVKQIISDVAHVEPARKQRPA